MSAPVVILGVTGSIAAYKSADLVSKLVKRGCEVHVAMTHGAGEFITPPMNGKMWVHAATQHNVALLKSRGVEFIGPEEGMLACGYEGIGRLWNVDDIVERAAAIVAAKA